MAFVIDPELLGLVDNVALVTGGGGVGMGRAHCIQLARAGCHIVAVDSDGQGLAKTVKEVEALGRRAVAVEGDVRRADQVQKMVRKAFEVFGRLDVAVNHVGGSLGVTPFLDYTETQWDSVIELNLKSTFLCCQAEALAMIEHDIPGHLINVASSSGVVAAPNISAYGAAKAGVINLTKSLAMELAPYNIRVNCIIPGTHTNERIEQRMADPTERPEFKRFQEAAAKAPPLGHLGRPIETAGLAVFFASRLSDYVTGHSLLSDGGVTITTARPPVGLDMKPAALKKIGKA